MVEISQNFVAFSEYMNFINWVLFMPTYHLSLILMGTKQKPTHSSKIKNSTIYNLKKNHVISKNINFSVQFQPNTYLILYPRAWNSITDITILHMMLMYKDMCMQQFDEKKYQHEFGINNRDVGMILRTVSLYRSS